MMPLEEEVQLLSRISILEPLSDEDLRGLLRRSLDTHLEQERPSLPQRTPARGSSSSSKEGCGYSGQRRGGNLRLPK
jgi:hypothetical protein